MKIKEYISDKDIDFLYDTLIITVTIMAIEAIIWRIFVC